MPVNRVLAVDDSHVMRRLVEVSLGELDLEVVTAGSGAEAKAALDAHAPDLLILDLGLPDMSGWDILDFVRESPSLDGLDVIVLSGYDDVEDIERGRTGNVASYLVKPFLPSDLRRAVLDALDADRDPEPLGVSEPS
ncbi:MAG TPA: response regulator [Acidimicrobiia bacterium]|nr:response regulator [Acidimicrobiia bacterium]